MGVGDTVPSVDLGVWHTPVERAPRLAARIGLQPDDLWVKRDDWLGLGGGGNKLRKLEFLCAHALEELGATVLVTGGATQSNYCRLTAASARRLGLGVVLVLTGDGPAGAAGNLTLDGLFQADVRWAGEVTADALDDLVATVADELRSRGERPAVLPFGGSNAHSPPNSQLEPDALASHHDLAPSAIPVGQRPSGAGLGDFDDVAGIVVDERDALRDRRHVERLTEDRHSTSAKHFQGGVEVVDGDAEVVEARRVEAVGEIGDYRRALRGSTAQKLELRVVMGEERNRQTVRLEAMLAAEVKLLRIPLDRSVDVGDADTYVIVFEGDCHDSPLGVCPLAPAIQAQVTGGRKRRVEPRSPDPGTDRTTDHAPPIRDNVAWRPNLSWLSFCARGEPASSPSLWASTGRATGACQGCGARNWRCSPV